MTDGGKNNGEIDGKERSGTMLPRDKSSRKMVANGTWNGGGCTFCPPTPPPPLIPYNVVIFVVVVPSAFWENDRTHKMMTTMTSASQRRSMDRLRWSHD
jgi:hypothetical protein